MVRRINDSMKAIQVLLGAVCALSIFGCTAPAQQEAKDGEGVFVTR